MAGCTSSCSFSETCDLSGVLPIRVQCGNRPNSSSTVTIEMSSESTRDLVRKWLTWDKDPSTRFQIEALAANQLWDQLEKELRTRIQFGTAGLRGPMRAGFANINCLTVIQASQGIASYLASSSPHHSSLLVVIGYDTRHQSPKFARLAANAFKKKGIETILFEVRTFRAESNVAMMRFDCGRSNSLTARSNMSLHRSLLSESDIFVQTPA